MCGIVGVAGSSGPDPAVVRRMCAALAHRGPDDEGYHVDERAVLGVRRLAIVDMVGGAQPVYNEDRTVVAVFNGELYNYRELNDGLRRRGHRLRSGGDGECLVHLYEEYGDDLVHRLRGMFAFAVWDARAGRLLLARDRVGKKPLYWRHDGETLVFGSELKALVADPGLVREVDPVALHHYLTYGYVPAPWSIYRGVHKLPPGHLMSWHDGVARTRGYWRLSARPRSPQTFGEATEQLRELLLDATRARLTGDRPIGVLLSGGVDSSAVLAAMARLVGGQIQTFTAGFEEAGSDERRYARAVARRYGTDHHEVVVTSSVADILPALTWHFDEPFADSSAIPTYQVARLCRESVAVVLNGDGGDECFGGYRRYQLMAAGGRLRLPPVVGRGLARTGAWASTAPGLGRRGRRVGRALELLGRPAADRYAMLMSTFSPAQQAALYAGRLGEQVRQVNPARLLSDIFDASEADSDVGRSIDVDTRTYLPGDLLTKMDIATMAHGLEARSPFLDQHLMNWAAGLPTSYKVDGAATKRVLKAAVADWLPPEVLHRPKVGFGVPMDLWLRTGGLRELAYDVLTDATARSREWFRPDAVAALLREHDDGHGHGARLWTLIQFELWHRRFLDLPALGPQAAGGAAAAGGTSGREDPWAGRSGSERTSR